MSGDPCSATSSLADNAAFRRTAAGQISQVIGATGDGNGHGVIDLEAVADDTQGRIHVIGVGSNNAFKIVLP